MHLPLTYRAADPALVRTLNTSLILECLRTSSPLSRAQLADKTGLNRSTVSNVTDQLLKESLIREIGPEASNRGRPGILLELNPAGGCAVGIEIGVGFISIIVTDLTARGLWRQRIDFNSETGQNAIIKWAQDLTEEALSIASEQQLRPLGIGIGSPGRIDRQKGVVLYAGNLHWRDVPIKQMWAERFHLPVIMENADNAAALGEYYFDVNGHQPRIPSLIYLSVGAGLGGGIVINGALLRGCSGNAGEIGHMFMIPDGELCSCGKRGCLETLVNSPAILRRLQAALDTNLDKQASVLAATKLGCVDAEVVVRAAEDGDPVARSVLEETGVYLARGISSLVNILNPAVIVLGGAFSAAGPFLLGVIERTVQLHSIPESYQALKIKTSTHGSDACMIGSVALVLNEFLREPVL